MKNVILTLLFSSIMMAQTEVMILSQKVGTEIDEHENRFYRIFPNEKGFINAQILRINKTNYRVIIVKEIRGETKNIKRFISQEKYESLQIIVESKPVFTKEEKIKMYEGMDFLRAGKIVNNLPLPQYISMRHSGQKKLKGTLFLVSDKELHIQTHTGIEKVHLSELDELSYKPEIKDSEYLRPYLYGVTGLTGFGLAQVYNSQRSTLYNEYGIPRNDLNRYTQLTGIVIGLIFSSELFDAVSTLLTPSETIILSEAEYEKKNFK